MTEVIREIEKIVKGRGPAPRWSGHRPCPCSDVIDGLAVWNAGVL